MFYIPVHESEITLDTHFEKDLKMDHSTIWNLVSIIRTEFKLYKNGCTQEEIWEWENLRAKSYHILISIKTVPKRRDFICPYWLIVYPGLSV